jgi:hypothetical protein
VRIVLVVAIYAAGIGVSYQLHQMGEPQSRWLWCKILTEC